MTAGTPHALSGPADHHQLDRVHDLLAAVWRAAPHLGASERARFTLIVAELVANVIEHGGHGRANPPHLELRIDVRGGTICGTLIDDGAQPPRNAPGGRKLTVPPPTDATPPPAPHDIDALRESGRGLLIVRSVADDLALTRTADGRNHWRFAVRPRRAQSA